MSDWKLELAETHKRANMELAKRRYHVAAELFERADDMARSHDEVPDALRAAIVIGRAETLAEIRESRTKAIELLDEGARRFEALDAGLQALAALGYLRFRMRETGAEEPLVRAEKLAAASGGVAHAKIQFALANVCLARSADDAYTWTASSYNTLSQRLGGNHPYVQATSVLLLVLGTDEIAPFFDEWIRSRLRNDNSGEPDETWQDVPDWKALEATLSARVSDETPLVRAQSERRLALVHFRNRNLRDAESLAIDAMNNECESMGEELTFLQKETLYLLAAISFANCRFEQARYTLQYATDPTVEARRRLG